VCSRCQGSLLVSARDGSCHCAPGTYASAANTCSPCPKASYCPGGTYTAPGSPDKLDCGSNLTTIGARATSLRACGASGRQQPVTAVTALLECVLLLQASHPIPLALPSPPPTPTPTPTPTPHTHTCSQRRGHVLQLRWRRQCGRDALPGRQLEPWAAAAADVRTVQGRLHHKRFAGADVSQRVR
jgi:hypothetical protein